LSNGGGSVTLPSGGTSQWISTGSDIYYNSGNVGIGLTNPTGLFEVSGWLMASQSNGYGALMSLNSTKSGTGGRVFNLASSTDYDYCGGGVFVIEDMTAGSGTYRLSINSSGNVGINTTSPTSKLQVVGLPEYVNNAAAKAAGLTVGAFYRIGEFLKVIY